MFFFDASGLETRVFWDLEQLLASLQRDGLDVEQIAFWSEVLVRSCDTSMVYERGFAR